MSGKPERRRFATDADVEAALDALDGDPARTPASAWPPKSPTVALPGLYSWWADAPGAANLSDGLGISVEAGRIYAGQATVSACPCCSPASNPIAPS
jgi:hypothetical protein